MHQLTQSSVPLQYPKSRLGRERDTSVRCKNTRRSLVSSQSLARIYWRFFAEPSQRQFVGLYKSADGIVGYQSSVARSISLGGSFVSFFFRIFLSPGFSRGNMEIFGDTKTTGLENLTLEQMLEDNLPEPMLKEVKRILYGREVE